MDNVVKQTELLEKTGVYDEDLKRRFALTLKYNGMKGKKVLVIGMNPASNSVQVFDNTTNYLLNNLGIMGYSEIVVWNLFADICTSITGVISELLDEEGVKLHMLEGFDEWTAGCFAGACGGHNEAYLGEIERFEVGEMPDGYTYLLERIPVLQEIRTENGSIKHHKTLIAITNGKETNKIVGLPTLWLEVKPDIEWFKDFQSAPTIMDFSMDVVGYCISDVTKILENFGKKQIRKIFEKQIMKFKKWEKEKEVHTTLSEEYYKQVGLILVAYKIVKKLYGLHTRKNEVIGFISQNITVSWHGKTVEKSNNNIGDSATWITP